MGEFASFHKILCVNKTKILLLLLLLILLSQRTTGDIGVISFWTPELLALLQIIQKEGNSLSTYIFGARRFYVTTFHGHNVVVVNGGESISNSAATTATLLQKFPNVNRIVGSGIAGGVVSLESSNHIICKRVLGTDDTPCRLAGSCLENW